MPKSRKRGGAKAHNKKVQNRNKRIQDRRNAYAKYQKEMFDRMLEEYEKQQQKQESVTPGSNPDQIEGIDGPEL